MCSKYKKYMNNFYKACLFSLFSLSLFAVAVFALFLSNSPSACSGQWTKCLNAFADNANKSVAAAYSGVNKTGVWNNYGFSISDSANISSIMVRADFFTNNNAGYVDIRVSGNGGATYGPSHIVGGNTVEQSYWIDVTSDMVWTPAKLNNTNFRVSVTCFKQGFVNATYCHLDWLPVSVNATFC